MQNYIFLFNYVTGTGVFFQLSLHSILFFCRPSIQARILLISLKRMSLFPELAGILLQGGIGYAQRF